MKNKIREIINDPWFTVFKYVFGMFVAVIIFLAALSGCATNPTQTVAVEDTPSMFVEVEWAGCWRIVYHRDTKVMYAVSFGSYTYGNFTLLVNPDGSPMLWEE